MDTSAPPNTDLTLTLALSTTSSPSTSASPSPPLQIVPGGHDDLLRAIHADHRRQQDLKPEERGVRLVQLLTACASYSSADSGAADLALADQCLRFITALASTSGDTMQRLASRFAAALGARLLRLRWPGVLSAIDPHPAAVGGGGPAVRLAFARALPYIPFARAIAVGTVLRALAHASTVHVIGLGWHRDPVLLAGLVRGFARLRLPGMIRLRFTLAGSDDHTAMLKEANQLDVPFRLDVITVPLPELHPGLLNTDPGEALAVVSVLGLHELLAAQPDAGGADAFLRALRGKMPAAVVVMEQEVDHNSGRAGERFSSALHYYGALFDSVNVAAATGRLGAGERAAVEELLGKEVENIVAREGRERVERHERWDKWAGRFLRAGFRPAGPWRGALDVGRRVVDSFRAGGIGAYDVAAHEGRATVCWHDRPMYSVSAWQC